MKKSLIALGLTTLLAIPVMPVAQAQGQREGGQEMRGQRERRNNPKMKLSRLWNGIGRLEKSKSALSKQQAQRVVAIVRPWSNRPQMNDSQAQSIHNQLGAVLTTPQKNALQQMAADRRQKMNGERGRQRGGQGADGQHPGGQRWGGEGRGERRGGGRGQGGDRPDRQRLEQIRTFIQTVNPFYAPTGYKEFKSLPERMQQGLVRRYQASRAILVGLSKKAG